VKVSVTEHEGCFEVELNPESIEDATLLVRMGLNVTKEVRTSMAYAPKNSTVSYTCVLGKRKQQRWTVEQ
jgi:hypothetical protein